MIQCQSPYHKQFIARKEKIRKYLGKYKAGKMRYPGLTDAQQTVQCQLVVFVDGVEAGRFGSYSPCPFCWSVMLNAMGFTPKDLAAFSPLAAQRIFGKGYPWVSAAIEHKRVHKVTKAMERDLKMVAASTLEVLRQLGIIKDPPNP